MSQINVLENNSIRSSKFVMADSPIYSEVRTNIFSTFVWERRQNTLKKFLFESNESLEDALCRLGVWITVRFVRKADAYINIKYFYSRAIFFYRSCLVVLRVVSNTAYFFVPNNISITYFPFSPAVQIMHTWNQYVIT